MELLQGVLVLVVIAMLNLTDAWGGLRYGQSPRSTFGRKAPGLRAPSPLGLLTPMLISPYKNPHVQRPVQDPFAQQQQQQLLQAPVTLNWQYPIVPPVQSQVATNFQLRQPVTPSTVAVQCDESLVHVEVQQDLFGNGLPIDPAGLSLGGCPVAGQDPNTKVLIFQYNLQDCNSVLTMTDEELIYTFALTYTPEAVAGTPITRADGAVVGVQCHYQRLQNVSSNSLTPAWVPYASTEVGEDVLVFSLRLMTDDWAYERPSNVYFLGDFINIEAAVMVYNHVPLRVFVDSCVATQAPDVTSTPRYSFIEDHGCFVDAKATASNSHFMPRTRDDQIQFQLEAFMFQQGTSPYIYITCFVKATVATTPIPSDPLLKSCSFNNGWSSAEGNDQACSCCDSTCGPASAVAPPPFADTMWGTKASVGPFIVSARKTGYQ